MEHFPTWRCGAAAVLYLWNLPSVDAVMLWATPFTAMVAATGPVWPVGLSPSTVPCKPAKMRALAQASAAGLLLQPYQQAQRASAVLIEVTAAQACAGNMILGYKVTPFP